MLLITLLQQFQLEQCVMEKECFLLQISNFSFSFSSTSGQLIKSDC